MILFFTVEMNYGIDFRGGSSIEVQAKGGAAEFGRRADAAQRPQPR